MEGSVQPGAAPPTEGAPAEPGQGAPAETPGLYAEVLEGVPSEFHAPLIEKLKGMDAKATQRFQQLSEQSKPYQDAGVFDADPEDLSSWLNLSQALEAAAGGDKDASQAVSQWISDVSGQLGLEGGGTGEAEQNGDAQDLLDLTPQKLQEMIAEGTKPLMERLDQQEQEKMLNEARQGITDEISQLRKDNPNLTDEDEKYVLALAWQFGQDEENPIQTGFEEFKKLVARGESDLFAQKVSQPAPAEAGGMPNTAAPVPTSENAKELALERLKQMSAT